MPLAPTLSLTDREWSVISLALKYTARCDFAICGHGGMVALAQHGLSLAQIDALVPISIQDSRLQVSGRDADPNSASVVFELDNKGE